MTRTRVWSPAWLAVAALRCSRSCSLVGGGRRRRRRQQARGAGHPRVVRDAQGAAEAVRGRDRLRPGGQGRPATPARSPTSWCSPRTTRPATRCSASTTPSPRGRSTRACLRRTPPTLPAGADAYALPGDDGDRPHPGRQRQRLRQRRRHLVRRPRHRAAADARRPRRAGVQGPLRHARRDDELAGAGVPAGHDRGVRRGRLAGLLDAADGQRRQAHRTAGPTPTRSTSPRAAAAATGRSCCPTTPRRPSPSTDGRTTTEALLDTCFRQVEYAGVLAGAENPDGRRGARRLLLTPAGAGGAAGQHVRLPGRRRRRRCRPTGRSSPSSPSDPYTVDPAEIAEHRDEWLTDVERRHHPVTAR